MKHHNFTDDVIKEEWVGEGRGHLEVCEENIANKLLFIV